MLEKHSSAGGKVQACQCRRRVVAFFSSPKALFLVLWTLVFASVFWWRTSYVDEVGFSLQLPRVRTGPMFRPVAFNLTDFGAVGDGETLNTDAFESAVAEIAKLGERGGGQLDVPAGLWLTAPFNLTSHMTLFLAEGAVILGVEDERYWPLLPPLPSYGYGREHKGPRYGSLIHGQNLKDVVITGHNGTINGQGQTWWTKYQKKLLNHTRGPLLQLMWSRDVVISNITLRDSPFWTLHPYDCKNVTISNLTILAPVSGAPNTDGIDPDSCEDVVIENCYICTGDDGIAIKSGWDQYGIAYKHPSINILIRNVTVRSVVSAGVSIGSEMSGGVSNVTVENLHVWESKRGLRIKTAAGRGGYVRNIFYRNVTLNHVSIGIVIKIDYNEHADEFFDRKAIPTLESIHFNGIHGQNVDVPVRLNGSKEIPVRDVSFRDMSIGLSYKKKKNIFRCSFVQGRIIGTIFPAPCANLDIYDGWGRLVKRSVLPKKRNIGYSFL
ncbi:probable polygalacturonase [Musa acuminata AAA Group]|uniref:probable polygalacturonase n=1 Tax=Musa acuminata AAA Group TaxID=214697 RepID=UPI0031D54E05